MTLVCGSIVILLCIHHYPRHITGSSNDLFALNTLFTQSLCYFFCLSLGGPIYSIDPSTNILLLLSCMKKIPAQAHTCIRSKGIRALWARALYEQDIGGLCP